MALASPTDGPADVDRTTCWADFLPDGDAGAGSSVRRAAAYDGREALTGADRAALGVRAGRFPLLG